MATRCLDTTATSTNTTTSYPLTARAADLDPTASDTSDPARGSHCNSSTTHTSPSVSPAGVSHQQACSLGINSLDFVPFPVTRTFVCWQPTRSALISPPPPRTLPCHILCPMRPACPPLCLAPFLHPPLHSLRGSRPATAPKQSDHAPPHPARPSPESLPAGYGPGAGWRTWSASATDDFLAGQPPSSAPSSPPRTPDGAALAVGFTSNPLSRGPPTTTLKSALSRREVGHRARFLVGFFAAVPVSSVALRLRPRGATTTSGIPQPSPEIYSLVTLCTESFSLLHPIADGTGETLALLATHLTHKWKLDLPPRPV